jgi:hypothetical protein
MPPATTFALIAPLVAWRLYVRARRMVGRQLFKPWQAWCAAMLVPLGISALAVLASRSGESLAGLLGGVAGGIVLGKLGLRLTRFEPSTEGLYYVPSAHIGLLLTLLLVGRIAYRVFVHHGFAQDSALPTATVADLIVASPLTMVIVGLRLGYSAAYEAGMLRWYGAHKRAAAAESAATLKG